MLGKQKEELSKTIEQDYSERLDGLKDVSYVIILVSNEVTQFKHFTTLSIGSFLCFL